MAVASRETRVLTEMGEGAVTRKSALAPIRPEVGHTPFYSKAGILPIYDSTESLDSNKRASATIKIKHLHRLCDLSRFPKLDDCAHFHYDQVELSEIKVTLTTENQENIHLHSHEEESDPAFYANVCSGGKIWMVRRTYENFRLLDKQLHKCIFDRKFSQLPEIPKGDVWISDGMESLQTKLTDYLMRFSAIAGSMINCGPILNWMEMDNRGNRLMVTQESAINTPGIAAAHVVKRYNARAQDEISFEVGDIISVIDMPPPEDTIWWRGKRGFEVGFFPCDCVEIIGDQVPQAMVSRIPQTPPKPVLRKRGKLISFLRMFFFTRPNRNVLKQSGIFKERVFGCDLGEHLLNTSQNVPMVLKCCSEAIEKFGIVDGIYRLSGVSSNIQRLRLAFDENREPDLTADDFLQDIHCISSLLKMYFRELPNPLLTYQLYDKFASAIQDSDDRLMKIHDIVQQLPPPHYRTSQYLFQHLARVAASGHDTGMHPKNLAIVWAPNLLRSKELESGGGAAALQGVGLQAVVTEFLIRYADLIFSDKMPAFSVNDKTAGQKRARPKSLAISTPTKLLSLEEARERALGTGNSPPNTQKYIEVGGGPSNLPEKYHTVIEVPGRKRSSSVKGKKSQGSWKNFFTRKQGPKSKRKGSAPSPGSLFTQTTEKALTEEDVAARRKLRSTKSVDSIISIGSTSGRDRTSPRDSAYTGDKKLTSDVGDIMIAQAAAEVAGKTQLMTQIEEKICDNIDRGGSPEMPGLSSSAPVTMGPLSMEMMSIDDISLTWSDFSGHQDMLSPDGDGFDSFLKSVTGGDIMQEKQTESHMTSPSKRSVGSPRRSGSMTSLERLRLPLSGSYQKLTRSPSDDIFPMEITETLDDGDQPNEETVLLAKSTAQQAARVRSYSSTAHWAERDDDVTEIPPVDKAVSPLSRHLSLPSDIERSLENMIDEDIDSCMPSDRTVAKSHDEHNRIKVTAIVHDEGVAVDTPSPVDELKYDNRIPGADSGLSHGSEMAQNAEGTTSERELQAVEQRTMLDTAFGSHVTDSGYASSLPMSTHLVAFTPDTDNEIETEREKSKIDINLGDGILDTIGDQIQHDLNVMDARPVRKSRSYEKAISSGEGLDYEYSDNESSKRASMLEDVEEVSEHSSSTGTTTVTDIFVESERLNSGKVFVKERSSKSSEGEGEIIIDYPPRGETVGGADGRDGSMIVTDTAKVEYVEQKSGGVHIVERRVTSGRDVVPGSSDSAPSTVQQTLDSLENEARFSLDISDFLPKSKEGIKIDMDVGETDVDSLPPSQPVVKKPLEKQKSSDSESVRGKLERKGSKMSCATPSSISPDPMSIHLVDEICEIYEQTKRQSGLFDARSEEPPPPSESPEQDFRLLPEKPGVKSPVHEVRVLIAGKLSSEYSPPEEIVALEVEAVSEETSTVGEDSTTELAALIDEDTTASVELELESPSEDIEPFTVEVRPEDLGHLQESGMNLEVSMETKVSEETEHKIDVNVVDAQYTEQLEESLDMLEETSDRWRHSQELPATIEPAAAHRLSAELDQMLVEKRDDEVAVEKILQTIEFAETVLDEATSQMLSEDEVEGDFSVATEQTEIPASPSPETSELDTPTPEPEKRELVTALIDPEGTSYATSFDSLDFDPPVAPSETTSTIPSPEMVAPKAEPEVSLTPSPESPEVETPTKEVYEVTPVSENTPTADVQMQLESPKSVQLESDQTVLNQQNIMSTSLPPMHLHSHHDNKGKYNQEATKHEPEFVKDVEVRAESLPRRSRISQPHEESKLPVPVKTPPSVPKRSKSPASIVNQVDWISHERAKSKDNDVSTKTDVSTKFGYQEKTGSDSVERRHSRSRFSLERSPEPETVSKPSRRKTPEPEKVTTPAWKKSPEPEKVTAPAWKKSPEPEKVTAPVWKKSPEPEKVTAPAWKKSPEPEKVTTPAWKRSPEPEKVTAPAWKRSPEPEKVTAPAWKKSPEPEKVTTPAWKRSPEPDTVTAPTRKRSPEPERPSWQKPPSPEPVRVQQRSPEDDSPTDTVEETAQPSWKPREAMRLSSSRFKNVKPLLSCLDPEEHQSLAPLITSPPPGDVAPEPLHDTTTAAHDDSFDDVFLPKTQDQEQTQSAERKYRISTSDIVAKYGADSVSPSTGRRDSGSHRPLSRGSFDSERQTPSPSKKVEEPSRRLMQPGWATKREEKVKSSETALTVDTGATAAAQEPEVVSPKDGFKPREKMQLSSSRFQKMSASLTGVSLEKLREPPKVGTEEEKEDKGQGRLPSGSLMSTSYPVDRASSGIARIRRSKSSASDETLGKDDMPASDWKGKKSQSFGPESEPVAMETSRLPRLGSRDGESKSRTDHAHNALHAKQLKTAEKLFIDESKFTSDVPVAESQQAPEEPEKKAAGVKRKKSVRELLSKFETGSEGEGEQGEVAMATDEAVEDKQRSVPAVFQKPKIIRLRSLSPSKDSRIISHKKSPEGGDKKEDDGEVAMDTSPKFQRSGHVESNLGIQGRQRSPRLSPKSDTDSDSLKHEKISPKLRPKPTPSEIEAAKSRNRANESENVDTTDSDKSPGSIRNRLKYFDSSSAESSKISPDFSRFRRTSGEEKDVDLSKSKIAKPSVKLAPRSQSQQFESDHKEDLSKETYFRRKSDMSDKDSIYASHDKSDHDGHGDFKSRLQQPQVRTDSHLSKVSSRESVSSSGSRDSNRSLSEHETDTVQSAREKFQLEARRAKSTSAQGEDSKRESANTWSQRVSSEGVPSHRKTSSQTESTAVTVATDTQQGKKSPEEKPGAAMFGVKLRKTKRLDSDTAS